jgi:HAE1 family hydrophobic/amphiphilic exporter-1
MAKKEAIVEAGKMRLRPILMTALTTIAAMSTMTIGMGTGVAMVQPMAVTVVGGLTYATLMTLFVVPAMYDLLHRNRDMTKDEDLDYDKTANSATI